MAPDPNGPRPAAAYDRDEHDEVLPPAPSPRPWPPEPAAVSEGSRSRRIALALSRASVLVAVVAGTAALVVLSPVGTRRIARATAEREVSAMLDPDERVFARTFASQRRPSDLWRLSHGLLVATDRRVLYVGAAPLTLLRPHDPGPRDLYLETWPYESPFSMDAAPTSDGATVQLRTPNRAVSYQLASLTEATALRAVAADARRQLREDAERLGRADVPRAAPDRYTTHLVQRNETLTSIARRYGTQVDVLRQLNGLRDDNVRAGQRLRVPEAPPEPDPFDSLPTTAPAPARR
jgi:hypothetical protein